MVKNTGGNKTKGVARKFIDYDKKENKKELRVSEDVLEIYAQVEKVLGGGMYHVICIDKIKRLCHSSGKFKGRNKKDNFVSLGSWLLVGLREYETTNNKKLMNCDLLEVYNELEKERLKTNVNQNWSVFIENDEKNSFTTKEVSKSSEGYTFGDSKTIEYQELMAAEFSKPIEKREIVNVSGDEEINIDDI
jgi:translation initiation factor 1A